MKITTYTTSGTKEGEIELPIIFSTPFRRELIHKAWTNITSHKFQPQGRHPTAGQDVVADSNDPPTGQGVSRVARAQGGGDGRQGQGAEVASTRGGRQAHPPIVAKVIYKKLNKNGRLIFTNVIENRYFFIVDVMGDWLLRIRNDEDFRRICNFVDEDKIVIKRDETKANAYIEIIK